MGKVWYRNACVCVRMMRCDDGWDGMSMPRMRSERGRAQLGGEEAGGRHEGGCWACAWGRGLRRPYRPCTPRPPAPTIASTTWCPGPPRCLPSRGSRHGSSPARRPAARVSARPLFIQGSHVPLAVTSPRACSGSRTPASLRSVVAKRYQHGRTERKSLEAHPVPRDTLR